MSETDFLKLKKHDNVETNTEKFDIENYLNGNWDKINKNAKEVNAEISNINSNNTELEKELKEAQEDFYQNSIRGQASGEYIHVEDSSNCRCRIGIGGNQEQETRSGKNLLKLMEGTYSDNGITAVVKNGIVTLNGAATAISFIGINLLKSIELTNDKAYHLSAFNEKTVGDGTNYCSLRINQDNIQVLFNTANVNGSITTNLKISYITIRTAQGITYNNFVVKPQLELGAGTSTWEQGGVSPSSDYQSPVKTVGSNVNYYNKETEEIGFVLPDGSLQSNNTVWTHSDFIEVNSNEIISITCENKVNGQFEIVEYDKNKKFLKHNIVDYVHTEANNKYTITTTKTTKYIIGAYRNNLNMNNIMVVKGAEVLPYNPNCNGMGAVKVTKCNKNLAIKNIKGYFSISGFKIKIDNNSESFLFYAEKGKEYTRSCKVNLDRNRIGKIDTLNVVQGMTVLSKQELNSKKFICDDSGIYIWFVNSTLNDSIKESFQIEEGSIESSFEQHEEQSYIMPIQKEMLEGDYFDFENEEEVHSFGKKVLTGNENWSRGTTRKGFYYFDYSDNNFVGSYNAKSDIFCNIAEEMSASDLYEITSQKYLIAVYTKTLRLSLNNISTVDELKSYLKAQYDAGTPVTIYYKLATPQRIAFTDEQKAVAKELNNARTYKNVTNITTDSKAILSLDYAKDLETLLTSKESEV